METYYFYIIYSSSIDKFYLGHTNNLEERLRKHNSKHKGFTGNTNDWEFVYAEIFNTKNEAYQRERQVKEWKNRDRMISLISKNPFKKDDFIQ